MNKNYNNVAIRKRTHEMAQYISKITDRSMASVIDELVSKVFDVACTFESANLEYEVCVTESTIRINVTGRNRLVTSEVKSPNAEKESKISPITVKIKQKRGGEK